MREGLSVEETRQMFLYVAEQMIASQNILTDADREIGDGDHGVSMARGFEAVQRRIENANFSGFDDLIQSIGTTLLNTMGGASGVIFGTWFSGGGKNLKRISTFDGRALSLFLMDGLQAVQNRGKAQVGNKTMVDALEPATRAAESTAGEGLERALACAIDAAEQGVENTKHMVAGVGRAKTLGERSLGHADPGAVSTYLILKYMGDSITPK